MLQSYAIFLEYPLPRVHNQLPEELGTMEVRTLGADSVPAQEVWPGCLVTAFVDVGQKPLRASFASDHVERNLQLQRP